MAVCYETSILRYNNNNNNNNIPFASHRIFSTLAYTTDKIFRVMRGICQDSQKYIDIILTFSVLQLNSKFKQRLHSH